MSVGASDIGKREPGVVALGVVVARAAFEAATAEMRFGPQDCLLAEHPMAAHIAEDGQDIVQGEPSGQLPAGDPASGVYRKKEGAGPHQVRGDTKKRPPLAAGFEHEPQLGHFEVSKAAVDQFG